MLFLAMSSYIKHIKRNLFVIIQIAVLLFVLAVTVSTINHEYKYYRPVSHLNGEEGFVISVSGYYGETKEQLVRNMQKVKAVYSWGSGGFTVPEDQEYCTNLSYPDDLIEKYSPDLQSGEWLNNTTEIKDELDIVISENPYGWKVGSKIELEYYSNQTPQIVKANVIGVLEEGTSVIGEGIGSQSINSDYRDLFTTYRYEQEQQLLILAKESQLKSLNIPLTYNQMHFVVYEPDITETQKTGNESILKTNLGDIPDTTSFFKMSDFMSASVHEIQRTIFMYLPLFICVFLVTLISLINVCMLNTSDDLRQHVIYSLLGLSWKRNRILFIIQGLFTVFLSLSLSLFCIMLVEKTRLRLYLFAQMNMGTWMCLIGVMLLLLFVTYQVPTSILKKNKPVELLRKTN